MSESNGARYKLDRLPKINEQLKKLAKIASLLDFRLLFFESLFKIVHLLKTEPLKWGDPKYRTKHKGGTVCQAILLPFNVHYVVFESEQRVCILDVDLLPPFKKDIAD